MSKKNIKNEGIVKELQNHTVLEIGTKSNKQAKIKHKDNFYVYKTQYKGLIDDKCLEQYGTLDDKDLWEDTAKELYLQSENFIPDEQAKPEKLGESKKLQEQVDWDYYDKFNSIMDKYLPQKGQGDTYATQIVTAINKLIYKWYNDGDVFDNNYSLDGWANDLSDYANWLAQYVDGAKEILEQIKSYTFTEVEYEELLKKLADSYLTDEFLSNAEKSEAQGDIYNCKGEFSFDEYKQNEDEYENEDDNFEDDELDEAKKLKESNRTIGDILDEIDDATTISEISGICDNIKDDINRRVAQMEVDAMYIDYPDLDDMDEDSDEYEDIVNELKSCIFSDFEGEREIIDETKKLHETTNKGISAIKQDIYARERQALRDAGDPNPDNLIGIAKRLPKEIWSAFEKEEEELRCIEMIHSILTYSNPSKWTVEDVMDDKYLQKYITFLGPDKVMDLIAKEIEEYKNATIDKDVYTDDEGVSYNSVTFKEEGKAKKRLPNISKFIYDLDVDKGNAWSVNSYTEDGRGNKIIIVSRNGKSENTAKDIKKAVENKYNQLQGEITENGAGVWFYLKPYIREITEVYKKQVGDGINVYNWDDSDVDYIKTLVGDAVTVRIDGDMRTYGNVIDLKLTPTDYIDSGIVNFTRKFYDDVQAYIKSKYPEAELGLNNTGSTIWIRENTKNGSDKVDSKLESKKLQEGDTYDSGIFQEIEEAFEDAGLNPRRFIDEGVLTKNIGWTLYSDKYGSQQISCDGSWYDPEDEEDELDESKKLKEGLYDRTYNTDDRDYLKELALNGIYVANKDEQIYNELVDRMTDEEIDEYKEYLDKFKEAPYDFVANNYTTLPLEFLKEIARNAIYVADDDEAIENEMEYRENFPVEE